MAASTLIPPVGDGLRIPARFVSRACIDRYPDSSLRVTELASRAEPGLADYTAVICDGGAYHYFHFMEAIIWLWVIQHEFLGGVPPARIVFSMPWDNPAQNRVQPAVMDAVFPGISLVDSGFSWPATFENVLIYDRSWAETRLNKILEPCMGFARGHVMAMARRARRSVHAFEGVRSAPHLLHITRAPPRCFEAVTCDTLLALLRTHGPVAEVDFAGLPWQQQVRTVAAHDVLFGVHGNGLTNALWMRPGSLVLEFFPDGAHHYDYQFFAELCGLDYFGFSGKHVFPAFCRAGEPYGHHAPTNKAVSSVPFSQVQRVLQAWTSRRFRRE